MQQLVNPKLTITLADTGSLGAVENHLTGEVYDFASDVFLLETDQGRFSNQTTKSVGITHVPDGLIYHFVFAQLTLELTYRLGAENGFVRRAGRSSTKRRSACSS